MISFVRIVSSCIIHKSPSLKKNIFNSNSVLGIETSRFYAYYYPGEKKYDPDQSVEYEVSKNPEEWKYVTRLLPSKWIKDPELKEDYPSGWKPPDPSALSLPYYVCRTKNHMIPVYLKIEQRGMQKRTIIKLIRGDIWLFAEELKKQVEDRSGKLVGMRIDEVGCKVVLRGDYVYYATEWIKEKGF